jgi:hypothetical protein
MGPGHWFPIAVLPLMVIDYGLRHFLSFRGSPSVKWVIHGQILHYSAFSGAPQHSGVGQNFVYERHCREAEIPPHIEHHLYEMANPDFMHLGAAGLIQ